MTEHELQNAIIQLIRLRGGVPIRVNSGNAVFKRGEVTQVIRGAERGTADIIGVYRSHALAIEVKYGSNKATPAQLEFGRRWRDAGGVFLVAWDVEEVKRVLDCLERE